MTRVLVLMFWVLAVPADAEELLVRSIRDLESAIAQASPGDHIVVADGRYVTDRPIVVDRRGEWGRPIEIAAQSVGGAEIAGAAGFTLADGAAHVHVRGFRFTHEADGNRVERGAVGCRFTRNTFACTGRGNFLQIAGDGAEVDFNAFGGKKTIGNMIDVRGEDGQVAQHVHIHHNHFHDFEPAGGNGAETIRFGLSGLSMSDGHGLVEFNLFVRCRGENELISNKSCANTYRYNTFLDSPGSELTLRHGNECVVYGNSFRNTDGMRIYGDRHTIFSNLFVQNSTGIEIGNGGGEVADGDKLTSHDRPDGCVIVFNTLIDNRTQFVMGRRRNGLGATATTFANNVLIGGGVAVSIPPDQPYTDPVWAGNLVWGDGRIGDIPATGYARVDPAHASIGDAADALLQRLRPGGPAIDRAAGSYPRVSVDIDGQPRVGRPDAGADEFGDGPRFARPLTPGDVGPTAGGPLPFDRGTPADRDTAGNGVVQTALAPLPDAGILHVQWFEVTADGDLPVGEDALSLRLRTGDRDAVRRFYCMILTDHGTYSSRIATVRPAPTR